MSEIWTTKEGEKILVCNMGDRHLLNAHRMVKESLIDVKNFQHNAEIFSPSENTMAYDDFEEALEESYDICIVLSMQNGIFEKEIQGRKLKSLEPRIKKKKLKVKSIEYTEFGKIIKIEKDIEVESQKVKDRLEDKGWTFPSEDDENE